MLRTSIIKENTEKIITSLKKKNFDAEKIIKEIIEIDNLRIKIQKELNRLQNQMNSLSKEIGICFAENGEVINNLDAGYLVRTKARNVNEGGVCAGFACLNTIADFV